MIADLRSTGEQSQRFLALAQVASLLGVSVKTIRRAIGSGELTAYRFGHLLRVSEQDFAHYAAERRGSVK